MWPLLYKKLLRKALTCIVIFIACIFVFFSHTTLVEAAACSVSTATDTQTSSPDFVIDAAHGVSNGYVGYQVTTGASGAFTDLWVKVDGFDHPSNLTIATSSAGLYHVGALAHNTSAQTYFYLKGVTPGSVTQQNYTLHLYEGSPNAGGTETCSLAVFNTTVDTDAGQAAANKVLSVTYTSPYLGGTMTMTAHGDPGTPSSNSPLAFTAATAADWPADCLVLKDSSISLHRSDTGTSVVTNHTLYLSSISSKADDYTITYTFSVACVTTGSTVVKPLTYVTNGGGYKHTQVTDATYTAIPPIAPAVNSLIMTKSVAPASSTAGGTATYSVDVTNNGPVSATLDDFVDVLPSSPATVTYNSSSSTWDNDIGDGTGAIALSDPSSSGQTKTWVSTFTIASGKTGRLVYQTTIPSTAGSYVNSAKAHSGSTQIDQTSNTTDNSPANATYGVGSTSMSGSSKTAEDLNGGSLQPGDIIEYTINASASGTVNATSVSVTDTIDTHTNNLTAVKIGVNSTNCGSSYTDSSTSTQLNITGISVAVGTACTITYRATVKSDATAGTTILNSATITPGNVGGISGNPSSTPLVVHKDPILSVALTENDADNVVIANQVITYTLTITNTGQATGNGIDVSGTISGPVGSASTATESNCGTQYVDSSTGDSISIAALSVTTSNPCVITYTATVNSGATSGSVTNSADVTAAREGGNNPDSVSASTLLIGAAPTAPNLSVSVADDDVDDVVIPAQSVIYTTTISNSGQTDATTSLTSSIPSNMGTPSSISYSNCGSPSSSFSAPTLTISSIGVAAANTCTITFTSAVSTPLNEGTTLTVGVDVAAASQGGNNPANVNAATLTVDSTPTLGVTSSQNSSGNVVSQSQDITYTTTIANTGDGAATGVGLTDTITGSVGNVNTVGFSNCGSSHTDNSSGTTLSVAALTVNIGTNCVVTYHATVASNAGDGSSITNSADATVATEGGNNPAAVSAHSMTVSVPTPTPTPTSAPTATPTPIPTYTLSGTVYVDTNSNGIQDGGETGYSGATVTVTGSSPATTNGSGNYSVSSLTAGTYTDTLTVPGGYTATTTNPATVPVSTNTTQNFGIAPVPTNTPTPTPTPTLVPTSTPTPTPIPTNTPTPTSVPTATPTPTPAPTYSISGKVFEDTNSNGIQDGGETGYHNATVTVTGSSPATTNGAGSYSVSGLTAGTYTVTLTVPGGYTATTTNPVSVPVSANTTTNFGIVIAPTSTPTSTPTPGPTATPTSTPTPTPIGAPTISAISDTKTSNSVTITWTTNTNASSLIEYGLVSTYGFTTSETNTSPRVTSHSVTIPNLKSCARYFYRVKSTDSSANQSISAKQNFNTSGCATSSVNGGNEASINKNSGGNVSLNNGNSTALIEVPANFSTQSASFQLNTLDTSIAEVAPSSTSLVGTNLYDLIAVDNSGNQISSFSGSVTFTINYGSDGTSNFSLNTLDAYLYSNGSWVAQGCTNDTNAHTLTCTLSHFSIYGIFGQRVSSTGSSSSSSGSTSSDSTSCSDTKPTSAPNLFQISTSPITATLYFSPVSPISEYVISYGIGNNIDQFGTSFSYSAQNGVVAYTINNLNPHTKYSFKVRGGNGCMPGDWSQILQGTTTSLDNESTLPESKGKIEIVKKSQTSQPSSAQSCLYTVKPGDSLWKIAQEKLGNGSLYQTIIDQNKTLYSNLSPGTELHINCPATVPKGKLNPDGIGYDLNVKVINNGKPVVGAAIELHSVPRRTITDKDGIARFTNVEGGNHTILLGFNGYNGQEKITVQGENKDVNINISVKLTKNEWFSYPSWIVIGIMAFAIALLLLFIFKRRKKDKSDYEQVPKK